MDEHSVTAINLTFDTNRAGRHPLRPCVSSAAVAWVIGGDTRSLVGLCLYGNRKRVRAMLENRNSFNGLVILRSLAIFVQRKFNSHALLTKWNEM